jgi:hypothetical protein
MMHKQSRQNTEQSRDTALPARITSIQPQKKRKIVFLFIRMTTLSQEFLLILL